MANSYLRRGLSFYLLNCLLLFPCSAQQARLDDWQQVRNLPPDTGVIVQTKAGERYHGRLLGVEPDLLAIESDERGHPGRRRVRRELPKETVQQVRLLNRGASTLAGAGIGGAIGAGIGLAIDLSARSNEDRGLATSVFTLLGAALGAGVGRHMTLVKGRIVYLAP